MYDPFSKIETRPIEARTARRDALLLMADAVLEDSGTHFKMRVRNVSATGLRADVDDYLEVGTRLAVNLRNIGWVHGTIRWVEPLRVGMAFDTNVDPELARQPVVVRERQSVEAKRAMMRRMEMQRQRALPQ